jgi:diadenylate cyclase
MNFLINYWDTILEILILWGVYYTVFLLLQGTVAEQVLKGIIVITLIVMATRGLNLAIINWLLTRFLAISVIAFLIIFQPEARRGLAKLGRVGMFTEEEKVIDEVVKAVTVLSKKRIGGLIALEREAGLRRYVESGVEMDSRVTSELINTIFVPTTPLHDGGIIVSRHRVEAAACLFPLSQNPNIPKTMGTRHRAAIGLSEETDAVVVVVSEETGDISIAVGGRITRELEPKNVGKFLDGVLNPPQRKISLIKHLKEKIFNRRHKE